MTYERLGLVIFVVLISSLAGLCACQGSSSPSETAALAKPDRSWVRLDGTVVRTTDRSFELNFGDGVITVEMDDWAGSKEAKPIHPNDAVIVYGRIDRDLHRRKAVEAGGVYVERLKTTFFASAADEEAIGMWPQTNVEVGRIAISGRIASISGKLLELDTGAGGNVTVDVSKLGYDPLDKQGFQQLAVGDHIRVVGRIESAYFAANSLIAERVVRVQQLGSNAQAKSAVRR